MSSVCEWVDGQALETLRAMYALTCETRLSDGLPALDPTCWDHSSSSKAWLWGSLSGVVNHADVAAAESDATAAVQQLASLEFNLLCADCSSSAVDAGPFEHVVIEAQAFVCSSCAAIHRTALAHQATTPPAAPPT